MALHQLPIKVATTLALLAGIGACNRSSATEDPSPTPSTVGSNTGRTNTGPGSSTSSAGKGQDASVSKTSGVTYANWARQYLESSCVKCHSFGKNDPNLSTEASAKAAAKESLESMQENRMPPGGPKSQDLKNMKEWVAGGAK